MSNAKVATWKQAAEAHERLTGERHCGSCMKYVRIDLGGEWRQAGRGKRWLCGPCKQRMASYGAKRR
jgi:hypothetical protein